MGCEVGFSPQGLNGVLLYEEGIANESSTANDIDGYIGVAPFNANNLNFASKTIKWE
jgi:hypothetical protein